MMQTTENVVIERRLFTVKEYDRFIEVGVLTENDPVELINGEVVKMSPISSLHAGCVARLSALFTVRLGQQAVVWVQSPIHVDRYSEPEPDVAILNYRDDYYSENLPKPGNVLLLIEVADTSLRYDRQVKAPMYAKAGVLEVWVVDVESRQLYVYRNPVNGKYAEALTLKTDDAITPLAFPEITVVVEEII